MAICHAVQISSSLSSISADSIIVVFVMPRSFLITNRRYRTSSSRDCDVSDDVADDVSCSPTSSSFLSSSWSRDEGSQGRPASAAITWWANYLKCRHLVYPRGDDFLTCSIVTTYAVSPKRHRLGALYLQRASADFDNFWQKIMLLKEQVWHDIGRERFLMAN